MAQSYKAVVLCSVKNVPSWRPRAEILVPEPARLGVHREVIDHKQTLRGTVGKLAGRLL